VKPLIERREYESHKNECPGQGLVTRPSERRCRWKKRWGNLACAKKKWVRLPGIPMLPNAVLGTDRVTPLFCHEKGRILVCYRGEKQVPWAGLTRAHTKGYRENLSQAYVPHVIFSVNR
jgi:hypothetical protein